MNLKNIILFIVCIFASNNIFAQNKISGNIKDKSNNENLPGVSIYIADLKTGASTDIDGNYQIENLKPGNYLINISYIGYKSINIKVRLSNDTLINFKLRPSITEMNDVIVTGVTRSTVLKLNPIVVKTIDRDALSHNSSTNLIDGLKNIPCVNQITTGAAISKPVIRGLGYNRVITLNNGIKQEGQQWGDEHGIEIDEYSIDRVEIVKGPGSLMYGSDGIAGVLNFLAPKTLPIGTTKTQLISNYQTNNNLIGYSLSSGGNNNGFQWSGRFSNKFAGDYQNAYDGKVYNSGFREFDGSVSLGINKNWGYSHFILSSFNQTINMIEGEKTLDQFFLSKFTGRACLIPFSHDDLEGKDKVEYLSGFESVIRDSEFVILYTGWSKRWGNDDYFANFPALDKNSAEYLSGFHLKAIGIDAISIDMADSENFEAHHTLLSQEILIIENLCHLDEIRQSSFLFSAFPLLIEGSDGSPVRAMASYE